MTQHSGRDGEESGILARVIRLESELKQYARTIDVQQSLSELTLTIDRMVREIEQVTSGQKELYQTHNELLKERAEHERQAAKEQSDALKQKLADRTPSAIAKRWLPMASLLVIIITLIQLIRVAIETWMRQQH